MKYLYILVFTLFGVLIGAIPTYLYMQNKVFIADVEGGITESAAMAELLAIKATEIEKHEELREFIFFVSCRSSGAAINYINDHGMNFPGSDITLDRANTAKKLHQEFGLEKCY